MRQGDIALLGQHRLVCGDAFNPEHVDLLMQGEKAGMLYCDPPYGMGLVPHYSSTKRQVPRAVPRAVGSTSNKCLVASRNWDPVIGDDRPFDPRPVIHLFDAVSEQFWWGADYYRTRLPDGGSWLVWDKRVHEQCDKMSGTKFELVWSRRKHQRDIARVLWSGVLGMNGVDHYKRVHPTQKPVKLSVWFLERYSKLDAIVVDLFAGSGSTLLACEQMSRRARVAEISPEYCQVIIDRWEKLTGQRAIVSEEEVAA